MREDANSAQGAILAGLRIVSARTTVTSEPSLARLHDALHAHGAVVTDLPLVRKDMLVDRAWPPLTFDVASYSWICVTSAEAVRTLSRASEQHGLREHGWRLVAVGEAAHEALAHLGWSVNVSVPATATITAASAPAIGAAMAELLLSRDDVDGATLLVLCSEELAGTIEMNASALGMHVTTVVLSRLTAETDLSDRLWAIATARTADLFMVTSPSAVDMLTDAISPERTGRFPMVCVGKHTARAARAAGFPVEVDTEYANGPVLVRAIAARSTR